MILRVTKREAELMLDALMHFREAKMRRGDYTPAEISMALHTLRNILSGQYRMPVVPSSGPEAA